MGIARAQRIGIGVGGRSPRSAEAQARGLLQRDAELAGEQVQGFTHRGHGSMLASAGGTWGADAQEELVDRVVGLLHVGVAQGVQE